ncbi:hypothetical protein KXR87_14125 [Yokenella regensburgei]|uniref:hypothetical protein n=1 Tax=Yokenella regensburgei TaxID=158877 RepID=UPI003F14E1D7
MYRSEEEIQTDIIVGEAVMELLNEGAAITQSALLQQLRKMARDEKDSARKAALTLALAEIRDSITALNHSSGEPHLPKRDDVSSRNTKH